MMTQMECNAGALREMHRDMKGTMNVLNAERAKVKALEAENKDMRDRLAKLTTRFESLAAKVRTK